MLLLIFGVVAPMLTSFEVGAARINGALHQSGSVSLSPYGVCADLCSSDGACRHVMVLGGRPSRRARQ